MMKPFQLNTQCRKMLSDINTPVSIYLRIRDVFPNSLLLESSDYHAAENSYSFICMKPLATFTADQGRITEHYPDGSTQQHSITTPTVFKERFSSFIHAFKPAGDQKEIAINGLFGYCSYDAVQYFEKIKLEVPVSDAYKIPDVHYGLYQYIIAINHFQNMLQLIENQVDGIESDLDAVEALLHSRNLATYPFDTTEEERSNITDDEYKQMVSSGKKHCYRGDVFQVVMSRQYSQQFTGDDFNVYRALRSVNPSPYLFYFDFGSYKIFGSSPEAQLKIDRTTAYINPIAGTFRRTGDDEHDKLLAQKLAADLKENAEHVMLVDLARNDLSRHAKNVTVESYRQVQFYSHVIHLVSSVSGVLKDDADQLDMMMSTFPAGTLSGAPKYKAMQLIDQYENQHRGYYGGAIGYIGFDGKLNHAIMIRTFLSKGSTLYYQAGAGIVAISDEESELQEVKNKLGALKKAIEMAISLKRK